LKTHLSYYENEYGYIKKGDIVFDCGSNLGIFAAYAASKGAYVYCFEPGTLVRHYLKETQKLYPNNIIIVPYGISDYNGVTKFI
jgi:FkbM family methyltransferase